MFLPFDSYVPSPFQLLSFGTTLLVTAALYFVGALAAGRSSIAEARIVYGWGASVLIFVTMGAALPGTLWLAAAFILLLAIAGLILELRHGGLGTATGLVRTLALGLPLALIAAAMVPTQWDDLSQWLPNARFLVEFDAFPGPGLPDSPSHFPAYPYGLPIVVYLSSLLAGGLAENAGPVFNLMLWLAFSIAIIRFIGAAEDPKDSARPSGWGVCAFAALLVVLFNPTWVTRLAFSNYSDVGTGVALGIAFGLTWLSVIAFAAKDYEKAQLLAWQAGLAGCALIGLRQANLVLMVLLAAGGLFVIMIDRLGSWRDAAAFTARLLAAPVLLWLCWRWQVETRIGGGEFSFHEMAKWNIAEIPDILARMLSVASNKGGYFTLMLIALAIAVGGLFRPRTALSRLCLIAAILFVGYNGFLLFAYVAAFGAADALRVASYWRYNTHLGGVCLLFMACAGWALYHQTRLRNFTAPRWAGALAIVLVVSAPALAAKKLRFDIDPNYAFARSTGQELNRMLSPNDRLMLGSPKGDGQYLVIMKYMMHGSATVPFMSTVWNGHSVAKLAELIEDRKITHVWVRGASPIFREAFTNDLAEGKAFLLRREADGWQTVREWAVP